MSEHRSFTNQPETWWDPKGPYWTLHAINPIRVKFITSHLSSVNQLGLDVGCGGGILTESLSQEFKMVGIDIDHKLINLAQQRGPSDITYLCNEAADLLPNYRHSFDFITCLEMLEHVKDPKEVIIAISELLKPGGYLFVSTLNRNLISFLGSIIAAEHILKMVPKNTHEYELFITPQELIQHFKPLGLDMIDIQGINYHPINNRFHLSDHYSINYITCFRKASLDSSD